MLSRHERERLARIESGLVADDPRLAEKFDRFDRGRRWGLRRVLVLLVLALAALLAVLCLLSGLLPIAIVVGVATAGFAAATWWRSRRRRS